MIHGKAGRLAATAHRRIAVVAPEGDHGCLCPADVYAPVPRNEPAPDERAPDVRDADGPLA